MTLREKFSRLHYVQAMLVALSVGVFFPLVVPLQTLLGNRDMFKFSAIDALAESTPIALGLLIAMFFLLLLSELAFGRLLHVIVTALVVCEYLETGVLSIGVPPLDGGWVGLSDFFRRAGDTVLLSFVFVVVVGLFKWTKRYCHFIALGVIVMSIASLIDVYAPQQVHRNLSLADGMCSQIDAVESVRFSPRRNVIVLVLDSTPAVVASAALREKPELVKHFPGFVAYEKNIAMGEVTAHGLPGLMTGKFVSPNDSNYDYVISIFGEDSMLIPYVRAEDSVYFSSGIGSAYTNRRLGTRTKADSKKTGSVFMRSSTSIPYISLLDVVRFRLTPYAFKGKVLGGIYLRTMKSVGRNDYGNEEILYPLLTSHPLGNEDKTMLGVFHTVGTHGPIIRDRNGLPHPWHSQDVKAYYEYCIYLMGTVGKFMDGLRRLGIYDNSLIILAADHGLEILRKGGRDANGSDGHGAESSILWIKPIGAKLDGIQFSQIPTSNCRVAELVRQSHDRDLGQHEIENILHVRGERRFLARHGTSWWSMGRKVFFYEWRYDEDGMLVGYENKGVFKMN